MLRIAFLSLLLGTAAFVVALTQLFTPSNASHQQAPALIWSAANAIVTSGTPTLIDNQLQLELDSSGEGVVSLAAGNIDASDFSFLHLALEESANPLTVALAWTNAPNPQSAHLYTLESETRQSLWLATDELREWNGQINNLSLHFSGRAGDTVEISDFSIFPASTTRQLLAIYSDLSAYAPWNTAAMNTYTGVFNSASFYPLVLAVALLVFSVLSYGVLVLLFRKRLPFDPTVVILIFFACWIVLDMFWQNRLLHQLADTQQQFAGKSTEEKLAIGPDAPLYNFVAKAKPLLSSADARVFVSSTDTYFGLRVAYYFYPFNVYWPAHPLAFPKAKSMQKGDYIALINPSPLSFDQARGQLVVPKRRKFKVELVFSDQAGTMVRIK